jgi:hypothetical protein
MLAYCQTGVVHYEDVLSQQFLGTGIYRYYSSSLTAHAHTTLGWIGSKGIKAHEMRAQGWSRALPQCIRVDNTLRSMIWWCRLRILAESRASFSWLYFGQFYSTTIYGYNPSSQNPRIQRRDERNNFELAVLKTKLGFYYHISAIRMLATGRSGSVLTSYTATKTV